MKRQHSLVDYFINSILTHANSWFCGMKVCIYYWIFPYVSFLTVTYFKAPAGFPRSFFFSGCNIVSVESPLASTLNVKWSSYSGATVYLLDLRVVNSTTIAPVVVMTTTPSTARLVQGLQPGHHYQITMKVFQYTTIVCTDVMEAMTGKKKKKS